MKLQRTSGAGILLVVSLLPGAFDGAGAAEAAEAKEPPRSGKIY